MNMNPLPPSRLKCEYLANPLGIATAAPRFFWVPEHPKRGAKQAAYQVIVSPERDFLEKYDSGNRERRDRTHLIDFSRR